ncbi:hypothetical protein ACFT7S_25885 [Streptomyces sp. NPDC057136]|uniref:hypothetical protein n=1 Tax=Streptomyces sp. NPDC057136 TaxID=3346029 RepID=UPI003635FB9C
MGDVGRTAGEAADVGEPGREPGADPDDSRARLRADLLALGRGLDVPATDGLTMAERVMAQLVAEAVPVPVREPPGRAERVGTWLRGHARLLGAVLSGLLVVLVLTSPVRTAVADWFDFGGVEVRYTPASPPPKSPPGESGVAGPDCGRAERVVVGGTGAGRGRGQRTEAAAAAASALRREW